jgi:hypothetical protein
VRNVRQSVENEAEYLTERAAMAGTAAHLRSWVDRPLLKGLQPDLYRCFMERTWRTMAPGGIVGLIHPESHFTEARAGVFRQATYERLRRHWHFWNLMRLFAEVSHKTDFGVSIYGRPRDVSFLNAASLYSPDVIDRSLVHDGSGEEPGMRDDDGGWDLRPHANRIIRVTDTVLAEWADLIDEPGTPARQARLLRPVNTASQDVLTVLARARRFGAVGFEWTRGWEEDRDRRDGYFSAASGVPDSWERVILQGPHFNVATPFAKQPNATMKSAGDYAPSDLEELPERAIPRTSYQPAKPMPEYLAGYPRWNGRPTNDFFRLAWREMADSSTERTLFAALFPPGPMHVGSILSLRAPARDLVIAAGMWASLPADFLMKVSGRSHIKVDDASRLPHPAGHPLVPELMLRALRLNCLTADYGPLWAELFPELDPADAWTIDPSSHDDVDVRVWLPAPLADVGPEWTMATPLRKDVDRRQALVELDALAAAMLGIHADELCAIYRTQFGVLRKYERVNRYDRFGRKVPPDVVKAYDTWQSRGGRAPELGRYEPPFVAFDREVDMTRAHHEFTRRLAHRDPASPTTT